MEDGVKTVSIDSKTATLTSGVFTDTEVIQRDKSSGQIKLPDKTSSEGITIKRGAREERLKGEMWQYSSHRGIKTDDFMYHCD